MAPSAPAVEAREPEGRGRDEREGEEPGEPGAPRDRGIPQRVVDQPGGGEQREARGDRGGETQRGDAGFDEIHAVARVVHDAEQEEAGEPGGVGLPLEPVKDRRHFAGGEDAALDHLVEPAAVHQPQLARHGARARPRRGEQAAVHPHEQERIANPQDGGDDVNPAQREMKPVEGQGRHGGAAAPPGRSGVEVPQHRRFSRPAATRRPAPNAPSWRRACAATGAAALSAP